MNTIKYYLKILIVFLCIGTSSFCFGQDTLKSHRTESIRYASSIGFTYQLKDNQNLSTAIFEFGTEIELSFHLGKAFIHWDGFDEDGNRTGGRCYKNAFKNIIRVSGLYYHSDKSAFGLIIGNRIRPDFIVGHLSYFVIGLNLVTNTDFSKYKEIFRPEIGLSFFGRHKFNLMVGIDVPINNVDFEYYNKPMIQLIFNYRLFYF